MHKVLIAAGLVCIAVAVVGFQGPTDIQIGIGVTSLIGAFVLFGQAAILLALRDRN